ncbi:hypothetical protein METBISCDRAFT_28068 [Metschnikowia bicuspidata]|uniref:PH-like domain-containing protein n=1 Tax=Metschnikowia bicuspidata TaxID=27322 RepID=A0A4P9ZA73_9ASCO|nr:hypothetical protein METBISCDRAFT_28068 [Metschnikowia bicuspidata]
MQSAFEALRLQESAQQENLIEVLSLLEGSKSKPDSTASLLSITRGLCAVNQKLLTLLATCASASEAQGVEAYKNFVSEFILWFDGAIVLFQKYVRCLPPSGYSEASAHQKAILHYSNYIKFMDIALASLCNPFVADRLRGARISIVELIETNTTLARKSYLNDISFDQVQSFGGMTVSCYFTTDQIVERSEDSPFFKGNTKVELVLLNLDKDSSTYTFCDFNALTLLRIPPTPGPRTVIYPPFRINELSMSLSYNCINFSSVAYASDIEGSSFALNGSESAIQNWFEKLKLLFPSADQVLSSESIMLKGLGISTLQQGFQNEKPSCFEESALHAVTLEGDGLLFWDRPKSFGAVDYPVSKIKEKNPLSSDRAFKKENLFDSDLRSVNSDNCGIFSTPNKFFFNAKAAISLPELQKGSKSQTPGPAVDFFNFGKDHNPTFSPQLKAKLAKSKKLFFGMFRRKSKMNEEELKAASKSTKNDKKASTQKETKEDRHAKNAGLSLDLLSENAQAQEQGKRARPNLTISIPKNSTVGGAAVLLSSNHKSPGSSVPLPFGLPSSSSTYYFKQYLAEPRLAGANGSSVDLSTVQTEPSLNIPQEFKDEINSDDTFDFYISPSDPKTLRVSKWKLRIGKWEMLTTSNNVFVKIAVNYILDKRWLLVFKEETVGDEVVDVPLLILDLTNQSKFRRSSASDIEVGAVNSISNEKMLIIIRCYKGEVFKSLSSGFHNTFETMKAPSSLCKSANYESNGTLMSSLMSCPSTISTLASLYIDIEQKAASDDFSDRAVTFSGDRVLLERMTVKVHKQLESYDKIHEPATWKAISMYSLKLLHSIDELGAPFYHFELAKKRNCEDCEEYSWAFHASLIGAKAEKIGKAGLLVRPEPDEIYMLECKGSKELKRLLSAIAAAV